MMNTNDLLNSSSACWIVFNNKHDLLTENGLLLLLTDEHHLIQAAPFIRQIPFRIEQQIYYVCELADGIEPPLPTRFHPFIDLFRQTTSEQRGILSKARQLLEWDQAHQYCGACGATTEKGIDEYCKQCTNPHCCRLYYPRISPAIIVAVEKGDEILMARSKNMPFFGLLAGYVESGETIEQTVHREVMEECGIEIDNVRYFGSQSWPKPNELMIGFQATYKSGELVTNLDELDEANFFHVTQLPANIFPGNASMMHGLLQNFITRKKTDRT